MFGKEKGDFMKIELNEKKILGLILLSTGLVFAQYSTISPNGVSISSIPDETETKEIIDQKIKESYSVGTIVGRMDSIDPSTIYGGTWQLMSEDAALRTANGNPQSSLVEGNDYKLVPIPAHTHTATQSAHSHNKGSMNITGNVGDGFYGEIGAVGSTGAFSRYGSAGDGKYTSEGWTSNGPKISFNAKQAWTGQTNSIAPIITIDSNGSSNQKIDVKGAYITINFWKKVS